MCESTPNGMLQMLFARYNISFGYLKALMPLAVRSMTKRHLA